MNKKVLLIVGLVALGCLSGSGCGVIFHEPKPGIWKVTYDDGSVYFGHVSIDEKGQKSWDYYDVGPLGAYDGFSGDTAGNGCSDCDCPRDDWSYRVIFPSETTAEITEVHQTYCRPDRVTRAKAEWVSEGCENVFYCPAEMKMHDDFCAANPDNKGCKY